MAQFIRTEDPFNPQEDIAQAVSILKRQFSKVSLAAREHLTIVLPEESLEKIRKVLDPSGRLYGDWGPDFIRFNSVNIVSQESGEAGIKAAMARR